MRRGRAGRVRPPGGRAGGGALFALAAAVALGACGSTGAIDAAATKPVNVLPRGAEVVHPSPPPPSESCNATASLQPPAIMPTPGQMPKGSYMAQIQARGYLTVGVDQNTYLWGYRDPVTGQLTGFDIDMLSEISDAIFGSTGHIHFVIVPNADRVQAVQKGNVDVVAETMTINCAREKKVDFSSVYYEAGQKILVPNTSKISGPQDLAGKRVCAPAGSTSLENLVGPGMPHMQLWAANDTTDCLVMLQQGQVDAISTDDAILLGLAAQDLNTHIVLGPAFSSEPYGMAISKAHPDFTEFVNGVLAQVRADGTWAQIYDKYLQPAIGGPTPDPPIATYR
jgi:polar amino acid transport system substrate-binding protein